MPRLHWGYQREDRHDKTGNGAACRGWHTGTGPRHDPEKGPWYVTRACFVAQGGQGVSYVVAGILPQLELVNSVTAAVRSDRE